jgi:hypothetical protein
VHHSHRTAHPQLPPGYTGHPAKHTTSSTRTSTHYLERGVISSYSAGTAMVQLASTVSKLIGPIPVDLALQSLALTNKNCLVQLLDAHNPSDAVVVAAW